VVGAREGKRHPAAERADEDEPAAGTAQMRHEGLGHRELAGQVDFQLAAKVLQRQQLEGAGECRSGVVDQPIEASLPDRVGELLRARPDRFGLGHIEGHGAQAPRRLALQALAVALVAKPCEDVEAVGCQSQGARSADPARRSADQNGSHGPAGYPNRGP
jgi:hypothetical protein